MKLMIELFSGSKTTAGEFAKLGYDTFTVDIDFEPDLVKDIMDLDFLDRLYENCPWDHYDEVIVWASPPCKAFSLAAVNQKHFAPGGEPLTEKAHQGIAIVKETLRIIKRIEPKFWFLENPWTGFLRHQKFMKKYPMQKVYYCNYGSAVSKPTSIWGEHPSKWRPKGHCNHFSHESLWSDADLFPGMTYAQMSHFRAIVPEALGAEIAKACNESKSRTVMRLGDF